MRRFVYAFLLVSFAILPSVTTTIFAMFACENIDPNNEDNLPDYYLIADLSIECSSDRYKTGQNFAIFMIFVYPIGVPAFYFYQLYRRRFAIMYREVVSNKESTIDLSSDLMVYEFLFRYYTPAYWYFEVVETARRLILTAVISVTYSGSNLQIFVSIIFSFSFYLCR